MIGGKKEGILRNAVVALLLGLAFLAAAQAQFVARGQLSGSDPSGFTLEGCSVAISGDGNTALIGGLGGNGYPGAVWVFIRDNGTWRQQGKLVVDHANIGSAVALSADGDTALIGGLGEGPVGAVWVFTRNGEVWTQNAKLVSGAPSGHSQGLSVALSADGNTALVGDAGAGIWVYARVNGVFILQANLVGAAATGNTIPGKPVALSADGNTALVGNPADNDSVGSAWVFTRNDGVWTQQGPKLIGSAVSYGSGGLGASVALSADGDTALLGGSPPLGLDTPGTSWVFTRSNGAWSESGKLVGSGNSGPATQGSSVALSADGRTAVIGGRLDNNEAGAAWVFKRSADGWTQYGSKLVAGDSANVRWLGHSMAVSADGNTAVIGATGAAQVFTVPHIRDFAGNGRSGALLYDPATGTAYTALSNGDGTYKYVYNLFTPGFDTLRTGDFNGDGKADLVVYNSHTALAYIGLGNGDGTFSFQSLFWSPGYDIVQTGDINGDGKTDFALYNSSVGTLYTAISNGSGGFTYLYHLVSQGFTFVRLADFTGDGKADLFLYNANTGQAALGVGDGTGAFTFNPLFISPGYNLADIGDLNGDGKADLILYNGTNGNTVTGISNGAGGFTFTSLIFSPGFTSVRLADYTGHATADGTNENTAVAYFGTGTGTGTFSFQSLFWSPDYNNVEPEDVNGDGKTDIILYNSVTGTEYTGLRNGAGAFTYTYTYWGVGKVLADAVTAPGGPVPASITATGGTSQPTAFLMTNLAASVAVTISPTSVGQNLQAQVTLSIATAQTTDLQFTLSSADPSKALLNGGTLGLVANISVTIPAGQTSVVVNVVGVAVGQTNLTASGAGSGQGMVTVTASGFVLSGPNGTNSFNINQGGTANLTVSVAQLDSSGNVLGIAGTQPLAPGKSATVALSSTSPSVGTITTPVMFTSGDTAHTATFTALNTGSTTQASTTLTASVPTGFSAPAPALISVTAFVGGASCTLPAVTVGRNLETNLASDGSSGVHVTLQGQAQSALQVVISSLDSSKALLSATGTDAGSSQITLTVPAGSSQTPDFFVYGVGTGVLGSTSYKAVTGAAFGSCSNTVTLASSGFIFSGPDRSPATNVAMGEQQQVTLFVVSEMLDSSGNPSAPQPLAGGLTVNVNVTISDSTIGTILTSPVQFTGGQDIAQTLLQSGTKAGSATLAESPTQAAPPGFSTPAQATSLTVTVFQGVIFGLCGDLQSGGAVAVGYHLEVTDCSVELSQPAPADLTVTLSVTSGNVLLSSDPTVPGSKTLTITIPSGTTTSATTYNIQALKCPVVDATKGMCAGANSTTATYSASATGYGSDSGTVIVTPSGVELSASDGGPSFTASIGGAAVPFGVALVQLDPNSLSSGTSGPEAFAPIAPSDLTLSVSLNSDNTSAGTVTSPVTFTAGMSFENAKFTPGTTAGTAHITAVAPPNFITPARFNTVTATVTVGAALPPTIGKAFGAPSIPVDGTTSLTFTITNPNASTAFTGLAFSDNLPAGLVVANPSALTNMCGGTPSATAGSSIISLAGGTLGPNVQCKVVVNVTGTTAGMKNNVTGNVSSNEGGMGNTASASVNVVAVAPPTIGKAFGAASIPVNGTTSLTFTITNPNASTAFTGLAFSDTLPAGLVVANHALMNTCVGTPTATAGSNSISLAGGTLAVSAQCTVVVNVTGTTAGMKNNVSGNVSSNEGGMGNTASASVTVSYSVPSLVWQNDTTRQVTVWYMGGAGGATFQGYNFLSAAGAPGWHVVAYADFNGDGVPDLVWQNDSTRQVTVWYMGGAGGATFQGYNFLSAAGVPGWHVAAVADFNGDGVPDLVWQNDTTRQVTVWYMGGAGGATFQGYNFLSAAGVPGWHVAAAADFNRDGVPDLVWQNDSTRQVTVWYMGGVGGAVFQSYNFLSAAGVPGWHVVAAVDQNGDGVPDLIWQNDNTRQVTVWYMGGAGGAVFQSYAFLSAAGVPGWSALN